MPCSGHVFLSVCSEMHAGNGLAPTEGDLSLGTKALEEVKCKCTIVHQSVAHDENPILWNLAESPVFRKMGRSWKIGAPHFLSNLLAFATPAARIHLCYARHGAFESE